MNYDLLLDEVISDIKALARSTSENISEHRIQPDSLYPRKSYNYGVFAMSQTLLDGIISLAERGQARDVSILLRTMQEAWANAFFTYAGPSHVWVYYLILQSDKFNLNKLKRMFEDGQVEESIYLQKKRDYQKSERIITRKYPNLPIIPGIISIGSDRSFDRSISIRQRCQIRDFYDSGNTNGTFTGRYDLVYGFLSETVHVTPRGINALFYEDDDGLYSLDMSGERNKRLFVIYLINAYLYHYDLMKNYNSSISNPKIIIPDELKLLRRRLIRLAKEIAKS